MEARLRRQKLPLSLAFLVMVLLVTAYCAPRAFRERDFAEQKECDEYCMTNYKTKGVLVPIVPNQRTRPDASMGPHTCTCAR